MRGRVVVVPYDDGWPRAFERERRLLQPALRPWLAGAIEHVGSTAIAGICAKPVIDMIAGVHDLVDTAEAAGPLGRLGYVEAPHRPELARRFVKPTVELELMTHALHLTEVGSDLWCERLAFRDALRADGGLAREYEELKLALAGAGGVEVGAYTRGKRAFVARVLRDAGIELAPD